jgi:hypothetical protein
VETAKKLVHDEYTASYERDDEDKGSDGPDIVSLTHNTHYLSLTYEKGDSGFTSFSNLSVISQNNAISELNSYLRHPIENVPEPLKWWLNNSHIYPSLLRMALNYLCAPGK